MFTDSEVFAALYYLEMTDDIRAMADRQGVTLIKGRLLRQTEIVINQTPRKASAGGGFSCSPRKRHERKQEMGLDIHFIEKKTAPRPSVQYAVHMDSHSMVFGDEAYISLEGIRKTFSDTESKAHSYLPRHLDMASEFVRWCEGYWQAQGLDPSEDLEFRLDA